MPSLYGPDSKGGLLQRSAGRLGTRRLFAGKTQLPGRQYRGGPMTVVYVAEAHRLQGESHRACKRSPIQVADSGIIRVLNCGAIQLAGQGQGRGRGQYGWLAGLRLVWLANNSRPGP